MAGGHDDMFTRMRKAAKALARPQGQNQVESGSRVSRPERGSGRALTRPKATGFMGMKIDVDEGAHRDVTQHLNPNNAGARGEENEQKADDAHFEGLTQGYENSEFKERKNAVPLMDQLAIKTADFTGDKATAAMRREERTQKITKETDKQSKIVAQSRPMHQDKVDSNDRIAAANEAAVKAKNSGLKQSAEANGGLSWKTRFSSLINGESAHHELMARYNHLHSLAGPSDGAEEARKRQSWHRKKDGTWATHGRDQDPTTHQHSYAAGRAAHVAVGAGAAAEVVGGGLKSGGDAAYGAIKFGENIPRRLYNATRNFVRGADNAKNNADSAIDKTKAAQQEAQKVEGAAHGVTGADTSPITETTGLAAAYTTHALHAASEAFGSAADMAGEYVPGLASVVGAVDTGKNLANLSSASGIKLRSAGRAMKKNYKEAADSHTTRTKLDRLYSSAGAADLIHQREHLGKELKSNIAPVAPVETSGDNQEKFDPKAGPTLVKATPPLPPAAEPEGVESSLPVDERKLLIDAKNSTTSGSPKFVGDGSHSTATELLDGGSRHQEKVKNSNRTAAERKADEEKADESEKAGHKLLDKPELAQGEDETKTIRGTSVNLGANWNRVTKNAKGPREVAISHDEQKAAQEKVHATASGGGATSLSMSPEEVQLEAERNEERKKKDVWQGKKPVRDAVHSTLPESALDPGSKEDAWTHGYQKGSDGKWSPSQDRDARKPVDHDDTRGNLALAAHSIATETKGLSNDVRGRSGDKNREMLNQAAELREQGKHTEADRLETGAAFHSLVGVGAGIAKAVLDGTGGGGGVVNKAARTLGDASDAAVDFTKADADKQLMINTHEKNMSKDAMLEQRGHHDKVMDELQEKFPKIDSKRKQNQSSIGPKRLNEGRSAGSERSNLPHYLPRAKSAAVDPEHVPMNKLFGEKKEKSAAVDPEHHSMNRLFGSDRSPTDAVDPEHHSMNKLLGSGRTPTAAVDPDNVSMNKLFGEKKQKTASVGPEHESMKSLFHEPPGFEAAQPTEEHNFQSALDPIANSGTRKGLGWFRKMKSAAGRASKSIRSGVASLKQRLGFGNGPVDRHDEVPRVGELPKKFDDGMNPSWHHPTRR